MADSGGGLPAPAAALALNAGDTAWMLTASALVLMMSLPGCAPARSSS
jgi:Amt family ammonium transporter